MYDMINQFQHKVYNFQTIKTHYPIPKSQLPQKDQPIQPQIVAMEQEIDKKDCDKRHQEEDEVVVEKNSGID